MQPQSRSVDKRADRQWEERVKRPYSCLKQRGEQLTGALRDRYDECGRKIGQKFGDIYQDQFQQIILCINKQNPAKNRKYADLQIPLKQADQIKDFLLKQVAAYQKNYQGKVYEPKFMKEVIKLLTPTRSKIQGDLDILLKNHEKESYSSYHGNLWNQFQNIQENEINHKLWMIEDYLELGLNWNGNETNVRYVFEMKRNFYTQLPAKSKKDQSENNAQKQMSESKDSQSIQSIPKQMKEEDQLEKSSQATKKPKKQKKKQDNKQEKKESGLSSEFKNSEFEMSQAASNTKNSSKSQRKQEQDPKAQGSKNQGSICKGKDKNNVRDGKQKIKTQSRIQISKNEEEKSITADKYKLQKLFEDYKKNYPKQTENLTSTCLLKNIKQILKNIYAAKLIDKQDKNNEISKDGKNQKISFYLVLDCDVSKKEFCQSLDYLKGILKIWFLQLGAILHVIGYNPRSLGQIQLDKKIDNQRIQLESMIQKQRIELEAIIKEQRIKHNNERIELQTIIKEQRIYFEKKFETLQTEFASLLEKYQSNQTQPKNTNS